jgi:predicted MFS family arabinose efflux permease
MNMLRRGFELLFKDRDFGFLMGTQFLAQAGDGIVQSALAASIAFGGGKGFNIEAARSPEDILRIALLIFIPYTVISPFTGVVIDRWDRRRLLLWANGFRAVVVAVVAFLGPNNLGGAPLYVAFLLTLTSTRVVLATKAAAIPVTVDADSLVEANSVSQLGGALLQLVGAAVALVAKKFVSVPPIVLLGAVVYGLGAVSAMFIKRAGEPHVKNGFMQEASRVARSIAAGIREVSRRPKAGASITTYFWLRWLWSFALVGIGLEARKLLAGNDLMVAIVTGGGGALGAVLGFVSARSLRARVKTTSQLVLAAAAVGGVSVAVLGNLDQKLALALLAFGLGFGFFLAKISLDTLVQEALGDDFRGRAFSLYDIAYNLAWVLAAGIMVIFFTSSDVGMLVSIGGVVFLLGLAPIAFWYRRAGLLTSEEQMAARTG